MRVRASASRPRQSRLMLLAPSAAFVPGCFRSVHVDAERHEDLLAKLQRLRGRVYSQDGAIERAELTVDGRHVQEIDDQSWHVLSVQPNGEVTGCARYRSHDPDVQPEDLGVWHSALAHDERWQEQLRRAVGREIRLARQRKVSYVEVGGWAIAEDLRFTREAADIALSTYALAQAVGGCIGITTATVRNCSSRILRKLGGCSLELGGRLLQTYYDPQYRCDMEILRFDSSAPNPRYQRRIDRLLSGFGRLPVICGAAVMGESPQDVCRTTGLSDMGPLPALAFA